MELQFKQVFVGKQYQAAQDKKARDKDRKAQGKMANNKFLTTETSQYPPISNRRSPLSDISHIPTPESRSTDCLLDSPKATDRDVDDEFLPIQRLLERPIEVLDLTGEDLPPGQPESPRQQPMAETDGHLQDNLHPDDQNPSCVGSASARDPTPSSACLESGGIEAPEATPQHARVLSNTFSSCGATATNYEAADLDMADGDLLSGEWEGEIVEEVIDNGILKYMIAWVPTLEPEENVGLKMKEVWEAKKAALLGSSEGGKDRIKWRKKRPGKD
ncbi:hypothetical protein C8A00DRAFT_37655 [Chaetomidium leptoderma]|uniref:Chromo domain-containing protein n=1 Tax=Chaetomidium leptoderma TaxID=669021 RepID=A0AAN6VF77_9PEZI|nr:hypothetical protein C8A00DRAFT_37655 [Chaetomidium leptoderma]